MLILGTGDPLAVEATAAIHGGDVAALQRLLAAHPELANARIGDYPDGMSRTLLHVLTDWPGHYPNGPATVTALVTRARTSTPASPARTPRRRCTGRPAPTTSRCSTRCWTRARTSKPEAQ